MATSVAHKQLKHAKGQHDENFFLAIALLNAAPKEQDRLILDLYDMDPRLVADVLDVVDDTYVDEYGTISLAID